jgi:hypothetical protein
MIRSIVAIKFKPGTSNESVAELVRAMDGVRVHGMLSLHSGRDDGLRSGNWDYALTADFENRESYLRYDRDAEHNRIRRDLAAPITEAAVRVQFEVSV